MQIRSDVGFSTYTIAIIVAGLAMGCSVDNEFHKRNDAPGGDTGLAPVAICDVSPNPVTPPFEEVTWDGTGSFAPDGDSIAKYEWTLVERPTGSVAEMPRGGAVRAGFMPDMAGNYVGELVVTTTGGDISEPCLSTLESVPAENLWVEMFWAERNDDMDLHLLKPGGSLEGDGDCYFMNCVPPAAPNWGLRNTDIDDPSLDLDDIEGTGPENINILNPESGTFTVYVHDYTGSTPDFRGPNDVTVRVYLNGAIVWEDTRAISGESSYTAFARIDWDAGTVQGL